MLRVQVLGPVGATHAGARVPLAGRRQLGVLASLVAARPEAVTAQRLLDDVWADAPTTSVSAVEYQISRLRSLLDPDRSQGTLSHGPAGYRLRLEPSAVDADRFVELARRGRRRLHDGDATAAVADLDAALALVHGRPYEGADEVAGLAPEIARIGELMIGVGEDRLRGWQQLGQHAAVIEAARRLTAEHPWREAGWALLATSLAAEGRQAEALQAIAAVRRILADELGLDPGPELIEVERAVLAQEVRPTRREQLTALDGPLEEQPRERQRRSTLPPVATELIGREDLVRQVAELVGDHRLVTLTGTGGVGKTRVAIAVASSWPDPVVYVELAPYDDPTLLVALIAERAGTIGIRDRGGLVAALTGRNVLLVLDNCEHLVDELAQLAPALLTAAGVRLVLTSREPLDIPGETIVEVPPLTSAAAVDLFRARAAALSGWREEPDADLVGLVCDELDRLPLALELAAARLRLLSLSELADGLDRRFELLADGHRGAPRHQQGLLRTVAWSVDAAPEGERQLLAAVSVFPGTFDLADVAAIWPATGSAEPGGPAGPSSASVLVSRLAGLVRRSLVAAVPGTSPRRYRLLITIRAFAREQLPSSAWSELNLRYLRHVRTTTRSLSRLVEGPGASEALAALRRGEPDQLAALAIARDLADGDALLVLVGALGWAWYRRAELDGIRWARLALEVGASAPDAERGPAWFTLGRLLYLAGEAEEAREALRQAVRCGVGGGVPELVSQAEVWLAHLTTFVDDPEAGVRAAQRALDAAVASDAYAFVVAEAAMVLGLAYRAAGDLDAARVTLRRAVDLAGQAQHSWAAVSSSWALMKVDRDTGRLDDALAGAVAMIEPLQRDGDVSSWLVLMHTSAAVLAQAGLTAQAVRLAGALRERMRETGFDPARMDPLDGPVEAALIEAALSETDLSETASSEEPAGDDVRADELLRRLLAE